MKPKLNVRFELLKKAKNYYSDQFTMHISPESGTTAARYLRTILLDKPSWIKPLYFVRDIFAIPFGINDYTNSRNRVSTVLNETSTWNNPLANTSLSLMEENENTIAIRMHNPHLDFILEVFVPNPDKCQYIKVRTQYFLHDYTGRLYFSMIQPFHRMLFPNLMKQAWINMLQKHE